MSDYQDFHHYKGDNLTPAEKVERRVVELLLESQITDSERESSVAFELKHSSGCCQIARILAQKRGLDVTISETASLMHDIAVIITGSYSDHAKAGAPLARKILEEVSGFSEEHIDAITNAIAHHSEKEVYSNDPYVELVKDVDVFDCSLYRGAEGYYRLHKPDHIVAEYVKRIQRVREELGLPDKPIFRDANE